jgi:hypothetical protein
MHFKSFGLAVLVAVCLAFPVLAHHSHNQYVLTEMLTMEGTITRVHFLNPHSWLYLDVKDEKGQVIAWALEGDGPTTLFARGVRKGDIMPGDTVKVRCHPTADGAKGCLIMFMTPTHGDVARGHGVEKKWD